MFQEGKTSYLSWQIFNNCITSSFFFSLHEVSQIRDMSVLFFAKIEGEGIVISYVVQ